MAITLGDLARAIGAELHGDPACEVRRVASLDAAGAGDVSFLSSRAFLRFLRITGASAVILPPALLAECPVGALVAEDAYLGYARAANVLHPPRPAVPGVHPTAQVDAGARVAGTAAVGPFAVVESGARVGEHAQIGPYSFVGGGAIIGDYTRLEAHACVHGGVHLGRRCRVHAGAVLGSDGFGFAREGEGWLKIPQLGGVSVGDDVEIGANTTVDRGALKDTTIANGVKIDNLVQIAHNVHIGEHSAIAGCVGIAGGAVVGRRCMIGGGVGIAGHLEITDDVVVTGMSMVTKSITRPGTYSGGWASMEAARWRRNVAALRRLAERDRRTGRED